MGYANAVDATLHCYVTYLVFYGRTRVVRLKNTGANSDGKARINVAVGHAQLQNANHQCCDRKATKGVCTKLKSKADSEVSLLRVNIIPNMSFAGKSVVAQTP